MRYLPSLLRVQIVFNSGICFRANTNKFDQMWYLRHICIDFVVVVNPFFFLQGRKHSCHRQRLDSVNKFTIPQPHTNYLRSSFRHRGAVLWNSLPETLRQAESLRNFRSLCTGIKMLSEARHSWKTGFFFRI